jgi:PIN domain nuclease of toxin-antitoxin system
VDFLIDTHVLLWWQWQSRDLSLASREALNDRRNRFVVSSATIWEVSIKRHAGKLDVEGDLAAACRANGFDLLPITAEHAELAGALPLHHTDPFDRMLIAQASLETLVLLTQDRKMARYDVPILG